MLTMMLLSAAPRESHRVEGAWFIATGNVPPLSMQQLVDRDTVDPGWQW